MDKEKIRQLVGAIERLAEVGQDWARKHQNREEGQDRQNKYWRQVKREVTDLKAELKDIFGEDESSYR